MKRRRILIVGINYSPELTGIGRYTGEMSSWISSRGWHVQVVTAHPYYPEWRSRPGSRTWWFRRETIEGVDVIRCPVFVPRKPTPLLRVCQDLSFFLTSMIVITCLLLRRRTYDVAMAVTPSMSSSLSACWYRLWRPRSRFMVRMMDLQAEAAGELGMLKSPRMLAWILHMETWVLKKADRVCPITPAMRDRIVERGISRSRTAVFPIWVDLGRIGPTTPDQETMEALGIPADRKVVLYSGAIGEKQGLEVVVEIACRLREGMPDLLFVICGTGPYMDALKDLARRSGADNILFRGLQPEAVFNQLLNRTWLHLVIQRQTRTESYLPSKLMNIMAVGGLVLVTAFPGTTLHSIVCDNQAGMLVTEPDAEPMVRVIGLLRDNPGEARRLKANALRFAREKLGMDAVLTEWTREAGLN